MYKSRITRVPFQACPCVYICSSTHLSSELFRTSQLLLHSLMLPGKKKSSCGLNNRFLTPLPAFSFAFTVPALLCVHGIKYVQQDREETASFCFEQFLFFYPPTSIKLIRFFYMAFYCPAWICYTVSRDSIPTCAPSVPFFSCFCRKETMERWAS